MPQIMEAMRRLKKVFHQHAKKEEGRCVMTKNDVRDLLESGDGTVDQAEMDKFFRQMDDDRDMRVDFQEFVTYTTVLFSFMIKNSSIQTITNLPEVIEAMTMLKEVFDKHAINQGNRCFMTKTEVSDLLHSESGEGPLDQVGVDEFFKGMDADGNGRVDFEEFIFVTTTYCALMME